VGRTVLAACLTVLVLAASMAAPTAAQGVPRDVQDRFKKVLKEMEVKSREALPPWAAGTSPPLFRFAQISDIHLRPDREKLLIQAAGFLNREVEPVFVAITGDNAGGSRVEQQQRLKCLLEEHLDAPFRIVRGDNWARNFAKVFGSTRYAFECGGIRFVFTGLDRDDEGRGIGRFDEDTWEWMKKEVAPAEPRSVVLFLHENVQPPVFVDAGRLDALLERSPSVAATFTGHLHFDLEFQASRVKHILAPGLGPHEKHPFKVCDVHEKRIVVRTVEWDGERFRWAPKYQKIDLPHPARKPGSPAMENPRQLDARETVFDMKMQDHTGSLMFQMALFARRTGLLERFLKTLGPGEGKGKEEEKEKEEEEEEEFLCPVYRRPCVRGP
jgi:hypothetical protein